MRTDVIIVSDSLPFADKAIPSPTDMIIYDIAANPFMACESAEMNIERISEHLSEDCKQFSEKILEVYNAPFARDLGIEIEKISSDEVSLYLDIQPKHINSRGFVHGGVIYTLMDHSLAFASNLCGEAVGQSSNIIYHRPVKEGRLYSKLTIINKSKSLLIYDVKVTCNGKLIASSTLTAFRLPGDGR